MDTGVYVEVRTASLNKDINTVLDIFRNADLPIPKNIFADVDQTLTAQFGRKLTVADDVLGILGDSAVVALTFSDSMLAELNQTGGNSSKAAIPGVAVILSIKDDAKADALVKDVLTLLAKQGLTIKPTATTFKGADAQRYEIPFQGISLVTTKGYWIVGLADTVTEVLNGKTVGFGQSAAFQKTMKLLPANQVAQFYIGYRYLQYQVYLSQISARTFNNIVNDLQTTTPNSTPIPSPTPQRGLETLMETYKVIDGIAFGVRGEGKVLAIDVGTALNADAIDKLPPAMKAVIGARGSQAPKALSFTLADKLSKDAIGVIYGADLAGLYRAAKATLTQVGNLGASMNGGSLGLSQAEEGFTRLEDGLKQNLNIDLEPDVLSWLGGEFAVELTYNKSSDLNLAAKGQWPFDSALVVDGIDTVKADAFIQKLVTAFDQFGSKPIALSPKFYSFTTESPIRAAVGTVNGAFVLSTGSGILAAEQAATGKDTLAAAKSGIWQRAVAAAPKQVTQFLYLDLDQIAQLVPTLSQRPLDAQGRIALRVLGQFESALIYSNNANGLEGSGSAVLILK
jgi:hypothetical protein